MKTYTYRNKGVILIEYFIVTLIFFTFLVICSVFLKRSYFTRKDINKDISSYEINKVLDKIAYIVVLDNNVKVTSNSIVLDDVVLKLENKVLKVYSNKYRQADKLFSFDRSNIFKTENKVSIEFEIKGKKYNRVMSLKWKRKIWDHL